MPIRRDFKLYLNAGRSIPLVINASQYDRGEKWYFLLYSETGEQYYPDSAAIVGTKADGNLIANAAETDGRGYVIVTETEQMTAAAGKNKFELLIDDQTHGTANFVLLVEPSPADEGVPSESDLSLIQQAIDGTSATAIAQGVSDWMDENLTPTTPVVDTSLTVSGAAADSAKVGQEISDLKSQITTGGGFNAEVKQALENLLSKVAYIDANGQTYLDALHMAMYPPANLVSISAVYTQSGEVYDTDSLDSLKSDLVVTANYDNGTSENVTAYALSGTLAIGTSTVTVTYGSKTATFVVTVTAKPYEGYGQITLSDVKDNAYIDENGDIQSYSGSRYNTEYFSLVGSATDLIFRSSVNNFRICLYDSNKNFTRQIKSKDTNGSHYVYLVSKNSSEVYYRLSWSGAANSTFTLYDGTAQNLVMEIGDIDSSTGADKVESKRIRSVDYIPVSGTMNTLNCPFADNWTTWAANACGFFFRCYDSSHNFVGSLLNGSSLFREDAIGKALPTNTAYVRIIMQKNTSDMSAGFSNDVINPMVIGNSSYWVTEA